MYDERIYYDPISDEIFVVRFYLNYSFKYFNMPDRFMGTIVKFNGHQDFESWLDSTECIVIGHNRFEFNKSTKATRIKHREGFIPEESCEVQC